MELVSLCNGVLKKFDESLFSPLSPVNADERFIEADAWWSVISLVCRLFDTSSAVANSRKPSLSPN